MSQANRPATDRQCYALLRQTGYDARGTLLSVAAAGSLIQRLVSGEPKSQIIRELEILGASKKFDMKTAENTGLGFQIIYDKCVADATKADNGIRQKEPTSVVLRPATKAFPRWLKDNNLARKVVGVSGVIVDAPSVEYATRFREILNYYGIESVMMKVD